MPKRAAEQSWRINKRKRGSYENTNRRRFDSGIHYTENKYPARTRYAENIATDQDHFIEN